MEATLAGNRHASFEKTTPMSQERSLKRGVCGLLLLCACSGPEEPAPSSSSVSESDSAGVAIHEFDYDALPAPTEVDAHPERTIGSSEDLELHNVLDVVEWGDRIAVAEGSSQELVVVALETDAVHRYGGEGDGPEEFRGLRSLHPLDDERLLALDNARQRYTVFDPEGNVVEERDLSGIIEPGRDGLRLVAPSSELRFISVLRNLPEGMTDEPVREPGLVLRMSHSSDPDTVATVLGRTTFHGEEMAGGVGFPSTTLLAPGDEGVWIGDTETQEVTHAVGPGEVTETVRWSREDSRAVTEDLRGEILEELLEIEAVEGPELEQVWPMMEWPDRVPAYDGLTSSPPEELWLRRWAPIQNPFGGGVPEGARIRESWLVVALDEAEVRQVMLPEGFELKTVGEELLWGVHRDELGVESIHGYARP